MHLGAVTSESQVPRPSLWLWAARWHQLHTGSESSAHLTSRNSLGFVDTLASAFEGPKRQGALRTICLAFFLIRVLTALGEER